MEKKIKAECICGRLGWLVKAGNGKDGVLYDDKGETLCCGLLTNYTIVPNDTSNIETYEEAKKHLRHVQKYAESLVKHGLYKTIEEAIEESFRWHIKHLRGFEEPLKCNSTDIEIEYIFNKNVKENDTEEIKITCPHCDKEIDYEYFLNTYGPEGCWKIADKLKEIAMKDCGNAIKQASDDYFILH